MKFKPGKNPIFSEIIDTAVGVGFLILMAVVIGVFVWKGLTQ